MRVTAHTEPGSPGKPNEDAFAIAPEMVAVLDGSTVRTDTGCIHGVAWYVERLAGALINHANMVPADALAAAISDTAHQHRDTCDLEHPGTPSAAVTIIHSRNNVLRYLLLGDVTLVMDQAEGLKVLTDDRVNATARAERAVADALPSGSNEKRQALVRMKDAELISRNVAGGFWVAASDPSIVTHAITGEIPLGHIKRVALLSDGAARAVDPLKLYEWPGLLAALVASGPGPLIRQVRAAEDTDPAGVRWSRNKIHDDATVALVEY